jgi:hypothetical protein
VDRAITLGEPEIVDGPIINPINRHRYWVLAPAALPLAQRAARQLGGTLAIPDGVAEQNFLGSLANSYGEPVLLGINDALIEGTFVTELGDSLGYANWGAGEPNNSLGSEDAVVLQASPSSNTWNDTRSDLPFYAIVEANCLGDLNDDGTVNGLDLSILLGGWGSIAGDMSGDGTTDASDLSLLLGAWGACPTS